MFAMFARITAIAVAAIALSSGAALASPDAQTVSLENRAQLIAARMGRGESYDQAARAVPPATSDERSQQLATEMSKGKTYRDARLATSERTELTMARWNEHKAAMESGGSHEAGWTASAH